MVDSRINVGGPHQILTEILARGPDASSAGKAKFDELRNQVEGHAFPQTKSLSERMVSSASDSIHGLMGFRSKAELSIENQQTIGAGVGNLIARGELKNLTPLQKLDLADVLNRCGQDPTCRTHQATLLTSLLQDFMGHD